VPYTGSAEEKSGVGICSWPSIWKDDTDVIAGGDVSFFILWILMLFFFFVWKCSASECGFGSYVPLLCSRSQRWDERRRPGGYEAGCTRVPDIMSKRVLFVNLIFVTILICRFRLICSPKNDQLRQTLIDYYNQLLTNLDIAFVNEFYIDKNRFMAEELDRD
jgi:hypothetical protein